MDAGPFFVFGLFMEILLEVDGFGLETCLPREAGMPSKMKINMNTNEVILCLFMVTIANDNQAQGSSIRYVQSQTLGCAVGQSYPERIIRNCKLIPNTGRRYATPSISSRRVFYF
jgi:hypothetical protein